MEAIVPYLYCLLTAIVGYILIRGLLILNTDRYNERKKERESRQK